MTKSVLLVLCVVTLAGCAAPKPAEYRWHEAAERNLLLMGERNWIVIAGSAQPYVVDPSYKTISTDEGMLHMVKYLLGEIEDIGHVKAVIYREKELDRIQERDAEGVDGFRQKLAKLLHTSQVSSLPREDIEKLIANDAKNHTVMVLKSKGVMPYSNIYVRLVSGYWDEGREKRLREAIKMAK